MSNVCCNGTLNSYKTIIILQNTNEIYVEKVSYQREINKVATKQQQYLLKFNFSSMLRLRPDKLFITLSLAWDCRLA